MEEAARPRRRGAARVLGGAARARRDPRRTVSNVIPFQPGEEDAGLEPLGRYRSRSGMSTTMRDVFDVLYEAGEDEALDVQTIAARTFERASGAAKGHARRAILRDRQRQRRKKDIPIPTRPRNRDISLAEAWLMWIRRLLKDTRNRGVLLRDEHDRYRPNPAKPPRAAHVEGTTYAYTRQAWLETTRQERSIGEIHTMSMEAERYLGSRSRDELLQVLEMFVDSVAGFGKEKRRPVDPRRVRAQLRWLLERPTTDESKAWLLHELTRRIFQN